MNVNVANTVGIEILHVNHCGLTQGADEVVLDIHEAGATSYFGCVGEVDGAVVILSEDCRGCHWEAKGGSELTPERRVESHIAEAYVFRCGRVAGDYSSLSVRGIYPWRIWFTH